MQESFWYPIDNPENPKLYFDQRFAELKSRIRGSRSRLNIDSVHQLFVSFYHTLKDDTQKRAVCEEALRYFNEKLLNSSHTNLFGRTEITEYIGQPNAYWKSEKNALDYPVCSYTYK